MNTILKKISIILCVVLTNSINAQSTLNIYPDSLFSSVNSNLKPGVFYVPKTAQSATNFMNNGIQQNCIRTNIIESALNNSSNLSSCLSLISSVQSNLQALSQKCNKLVFIFEKMPGWLSSSTNSLPASTPGWFVLNTKPPSNWNTWQTVVDSITSKIVNQFGISNAYFEIWNEPDLGSWTGSMGDYFTLYKRTYDGIKSANSLAKVGGPTVNFWANNIYWKPAYGYISNSKADSSLIGQLLDSSVTWNKVPDFISWHNFNLSYQEFGNATNYVKQKLISLSLPNIPLIVSEWNAPSQVRDNPLATSFMIKAQLAISKTSISNNVIAAWQDFSFSTNEFHNDYGLITYGAIHKPAYNAVLLSEKLNGLTCKMLCSAPYDGVSSIINDTLNILLSNFCPPPFVEALNATLYQGQFNINQLDSAGYININTNNISHLDSIYKGLISIPNSNSMQIAINNAIGTYQHFNTILTSPRHFNMNLNGYAGNYFGKLFIIDSTTNNMQFKYDSLLTASYTQTAAISTILPNQNLNYVNVTVTGGQLSFSLQPNAVCLFKIALPQTNGVLENYLSLDKLGVHPNPSSQKITINLPSKQLSEEVFMIYNSNGALIRTFNTEKQSTVIDISELPNGFYFITCKNSKLTPVKFIKQ